MTPTAHESPLNDISVSSAIFAQFIHSLIAHYTEKSAKFAVWDNVL